MTNEMRASVVQPPSANLPTRVSYSQLAQYEQCPLKYYFNRIAGFTEPQTAALVGGTVTHEVIEHLYRLPAEARTLKRPVNCSLSMGPNYSRVPTTNLSQLTTI